MSPSVQSRSRTVLSGILIVMGLVCGPWLPPAAAIATSPDPTSSTPQPSVALKPLPDGDYITASLTLDEITQAMRAAGVTDALVAEWRDSMPAGDEVFDLRLRDGRLYGGNRTNGGALDFGWNGAFQFVDDHTLVADDGQGTITVGFQTADNQVRFKVLQDLNPYPNDIIWLIAFYQAAPFTLATAAASPDATSAPVASPSGASDPIPQGDYTSGSIDAALVTSTLRAAGLPAADIQPVIDAIAAMTAVFTLRLRDGVLTELQSSDGGPAEIGWRGGYAFADDHTLVADDGQGANTYAFRWQDGALHIDVIQDLSADPIDFAIQTAIYESTPFTPVSEPSSSPAVPSAS